VRVELHPVPSASLLEDLKPDAREGCRVMGQAVELVRVGGSVPPIRSVIGERLAEEGRDPKAEPCF
jgi:hypothetical protein